MHGDSFDGFALVIGVDFYNFVNMAAFVSCIEGDFDFTGRAGVDDF